MSYVIKVTAFPLNVQEQEMGCGNKVKFSTFTSCIGVLGYNEDDEVVVGIHLVMFDSNKKAFDFAAAQKVITLMSECNQKVILGCVAEWRESQDSNVSAGFKAMQNSMKNLKILNLGGNQNNPKYGGRLANGNFEIKKAGVWTKFQNLMDIK